MAYDRNNLLRLTILGLMIVFLVACGVKPSGTVITEERLMEDGTVINMIEVTDGLHLTVSLTETLSVSVQADDNIIGHIMTESRDSILRISLADGFRLKKNNTPRICISTPSLTALAASGNAEIRIEGEPSGNYINIDLNDNAKLSGAIYVFAADIALDRKSRINLEGECHAANISCRGKSTLRGYGLSVNNAGIVLSGKSKIELEINDKVMVQSDGRSSLRYTGNAKIIRLQDDDLQTPEDFIIKVIERSYTAPAPNSDEYTHKNSRSDHRKSTTASTAPRRCKS